MTLLQERDRILLRLCYEQQFIMVEQVLRFFRNSSYRECRRRVTELQDAGYLREELSTVTGQKGVIRLTQLGTRLAQEGHTLRVPQSKILRPATMIHDAIVTDVRLRLQEFWPRAQFVPERAIKGREYRQIPDGIFFFPSGKGIAIEIENSDKGRTRFIQLLGRWKDIPQIIFVLFVSTNPNLLGSIRRYLSHGPSDQPMGVVGWDDLKQGRPSVWSGRGDVPLFERCEY